MDFSRKKMVSVADKPTGFWGRKMLNSMHDHHKELINWGLDGTDIAGYHEILDIGCGSGNSLSYMYRKNKKAHFFGLDYSKDAVKTAKKNNKDAVAKNRMKISHGDVVKMPYPDSSFDLVVSIESFYYWKNHERALKEISRVMRKNGRLMIILEAHGDVDDPQKYEEITDILDMFIPGEKDFTELFESAGFSVTIEKKDDWIKAIGIKK